MRHLGMYASRRGRSTVPAGRGGHMSAEFPAPHHDVPVAALTVRACACGGGCPRCAASGAAVSRSQDPRERDAERFADSTMRGEPRAIRALAAAASMPGLRIHTGDEAARAADALDANAFTVGSDVYFGAGRYAPDTPAGGRLLAHELAHVAQQAGGAPRQIQRQERSGVSVRSPTLEISALRNQQFLAFAGSPLLPAERSTAASIFGSSLNLDAIRIVHSPVIAAPTTLGNTIRVPPSYVMPDHVLIHELTHIWQYQTMGSAYISDSLLHQAAATVSSLVTSGTADRSGAYTYAIVPGQSFYDYTAEQQASIVEDYFRNPSLRTDREYQRLIAQVRAARPLNVTQAFWEEYAAGLPPREWALPQPAVPFGAEGGVVPQIEIRFPGL